MLISPEDRAWLDWVLLSSHPIRSVDADENPNGFGSATLVDYRGRRFMLTVQHVAPLGSSGWFLELGYETETGKGTATYKPNSLLYLAEFSRRTGNVRAIDFCYCELPQNLNSNYQHRTPFVSGEQFQRHVFDMERPANPTSDQTFAFAGETRPEQHAPGSIAMQMNVFPGLKYLRTEDEIHIFKLPVPHPGHAEFKGCSGAPIVDKKKQVVALVCGGDENEGTIRGVSVARYRFALDFYCQSQVGS